MRLQDLTLNLENPPIAQVLLFEQLSNYQQLKNLASTFLILWQFEQELQVQKNLENQFWKDQ